MTNISKIELNPIKLNNYDNSKFNNDWPVVYILNGNKDAYIGQTSNYIRRMINHINTPQKKDVLNNSYRIEDDTFNTSVALDLESFLIEHMAADGKYQLLNGNAGLRNHNYYQKSSYREKFKYIWDLLKEKDLVNNDLLEIQNSDIFKLSPFKSLSEEQYSILLDIVKTLVNGEETKIESRSVINGNPGTGKTVLAIYIIKYLIDTKIFKDKKIGLIVPMTSLRKTIKRIFKSVKGLKPSMVLGPYDLDKDDKYDILIVDESHRLTRYKNLSNNAAFKNKAFEYGLDYKTTNQLEWIKASCKHLILFYDKNQTVKPSDFNLDNFDEIVNPTNTYYLHGQFRVKANFDYPQFIDNLLRQKESELNKITLEDLGKYDLKIFDNIEDLETQIRNKNTLHGLSRMVSGYSWKWESKGKPIHSNIYDIEIQNRFYKWNSTNIDWINSENSINEVGCIHTTQGYDLNYCGVIIGKDLILKDGIIQYNKDGYKDNQSKDNSIGKDMLKYIINIYKVLLTRGIYGTYIYVCDDNLRNYLKKYIPTFKENIYQQDQIEKIDLVAEVDLE